MWSHGQQSHYSYTGCAIALQYVGVTLRNTLIIYNCDL